MSTKTPASTSGGTGGGSVPPGLFNSAVSSHESGDLDTAANLYSEVLRHDPGHADALHLLGLVSHQKGRHDDAERLIGQAVERNPGMAYFHNNLGEVKRVRGAFGEAVDCYREAVRLDPDYAQAHHNLGRALHAQGAYEDAVGAYQAAPDSADIANDLGITYQALGRVEEAIASFREALESNPENVEAGNNLGAALRIENRLDEAEEALRAALRTDPDCARAWFNLVGVHLSRNALGEAAIACRKAVDLAPDQADFQATLGLIQGALGKIDESIEHLRKAVEIAPEHAQAYNDLGVSLMMSGELDESIACFRKSAALDPGMVVAHYNMTRAKKYTPADQAEIDALEALLQTPALADQSCIHLHFALGKMHDDCKADERAIAHFRSANALRRKSIDYDAAAVTAYVDQTCALFSEPFLEGCGDWGNSSDKPIFIVGMVRSGTTLVEQILASHPQVGGGGEIEFFGNLARELPEGLSAADGYPACIAALDTDLAGSIAKDYLARLERDAGSSARITDKRPLNFQHLGLIALLFPNARIIHCVRDPLDVCLSAYFQNFTTENEYAYELGELGAFYREYRRLMAHWERVLPGRIYEVGYESLVDDQEGVSRALIEHCGLEWDEHCLEFFKTRRPVGTASVWQVRQPVYRESVAKWKRYEEHLDELKAALED